MGDPTRTNEVYLAPGPCTVEAMKLPGSRFPAPDDHVVEPETGREMIDGKIVEVAPSKPPHADRQLALGYVLEATVAPNYVASVELLTRVNEDNDFATDLCIRRAGKDEEGHRYLEELSFEIKFTQSESDIKKRARYLTRRGVRRVFAVYVRVEKQDGDERVIAGPIKEWSTAEDDWKVLEDDSAIEDRCLSRPVPVLALLDAFEADNAVARALLDKHNPVFTEFVERAKREAKREVKRRERRQTIRDLCRALAIEITPARQAHIDSLDVDELLALRGRLLELRSWADE